MILLLVGELKLVNGDVKAQVAVYAACRLDEGTLLADPVPLQLEIFC